MAENEKYSDTSAVIHHQKLVDPSIEPVVYCFMKCQKDPTSTSITKTAISNQKVAEMTEMRKNPMFWQWYINKTWLTPNSSQYPDFFTRLHRRRRGFRLGGRRLLGGPQGPQIGRLGPLTRPVLACLQCTLFNGAHFAYFSVLMTSNWFHRDNWALKGPFYCSFSTICFEGAPFLGAPFSK